MKRKKCTCCRKLKKLSQFSIRKQNKDNHDSWCQECYRIKSREYGKKHLKQKLEYNKKWRKENSEKYHKSNKDYYAKNKKIMNKRVKLWKINNSKKVKKWRIKDYKYRINNDISWKILRNLRTRIHHALVRETKSKPTIKLLNCSIKKLKYYIQKQFKKDMTWNNYGKWHIDHIRPCASFDLSKPEEQRKCFNYKNLQPLWGKENQSKGAKYEK